MLVEDLEKEIADARADNAEDEAKYDKQASSVQDLIDTRNETIVSLEEQLASVDKELDGEEENSATEAKKIKGAKQTRKLVDSDCQWVKSHFQKRREKRKVEMMGLTDAKR